MPFMSVFILLSFIISSVYYVKFLPLGFITVRDKGILAISRMMLVSLVSAA